MAHLLVPKILDVPQKLVPLLDPDVFNKYRYFLLEGGRGGGKSQTIARFVLYLAEKYKLRVVCGRETQNSITESVYSLLTDLIRENQMAFTIQANSIIHRLSDSTFNFRGFRQQGAANIQGMEGVDLLWIDEAQAITKETLDVLIPTIRKDNARIFFSMNRYVRNDPVYAMFSARDDCLHIKINYDENPHCTAALKREADECRKLSEQDYKHIWLGEPLDQAEDALFSVSELERAQQVKHPLNPNYGYRVAGFDIARYGDDKCAAVILQQMGALHWGEIFVDEWDHRDLNYTTGRIYQITNEYHVDRAAIDADGLGAGPFDTLFAGRGDQRFVGFTNPVLSYEKNKSFVNPRTVNAYKLKDMFQQDHLCLKDQKTIDELLTLRYTFDHQQRRVLISKDKMRKDGIKSPNRADALIMAVSLAGEAKERQEEQYEPAHQFASKEDNLFQLAGIR